MRRAVTIAVLGALVGSADVPAGQSPAGAQISKGLQMSVVSVQRAGTASLNDCPPGENRVNATTKPGEEFAIVSVAFKVLPAFQPGPIKRPVLTDAAGKTYNTAVSFVDIGKVPEFSCQFPYRVPAGTALKSLTIDTAAIDLSGLEKK